MALSITAGSTTKEALARNMNKSGVGGVIGAVNAGNYTDKRPGNAGNFRVDNQNPTTTHANLQVQVNGITGEKSSIGGALIPLALGKEIGNTKDAKSKVARKTELTRAIQGALTRSVGTWKVVTSGQQSHGEYQQFIVAGTFSS